MLDNNGRYLFRTQPPPFAAGKNKQWKIRNYMFHCPVQSVYNGIHSMFVPYSLMKVQPGSWLLQATKYKASVAIVRVIFNK